MSEIQLSKFNFSIQLTPFAAYIVLKRSLQVDKEGTLALPPQPSLVLLQQAQQDHLNAKKEITHLKNHLKDMERKYEDLGTINSSLLKKLESADLDIDVATQRNDELTKKITLQEKELSKVLAIQKEAKLNSKLLKAEHKEYIVQTDTQIKAYSNSDKVQKKEIHNLQKTITNLKDKNNNLKSEVSQLKIREGSTRKLEKELARLKQKKLISSVSSQTSCTSDTSNMADPENDTKNQQLQTFKTDLENLLKKSLAKGDAWYLVDSHWFKLLKKYVGMDGAMFDSGGKDSGEEYCNPGPINNKPLLKDDGSDIRDHMINEMDYVLVPEEAWEKLVEKFGLSDGQQPVRRKVVERGVVLLNGTTVKYCKVEVYF